MSAKKPWLLYHIMSEGVVVVQKADHHYHLAQAREDAGLPPPNYLAAVKEPLNAQQIASFEKQYEVKINTSPQPDLPPYREPAKVKENRMAWDAKRAARKAGK